MRRDAVLLAALLLSSGCSDREPTALQLQDNSFAMQPLHATLFSNIREPRRLLIRDAETWAALWAQMVNAATPAEPPYVDFAKEDVLVAAMGEQRAGGYAISIASVEPGEHATRVITTSLVPGPDCDRSDVITAPLDAVRIRKLTGAIEFTEQTVLRSCS